MKKSNGAKHDEETHGFKRVRVTAGKRCDIANKQNNPAMEIMILKSVVTWFMVLKIAEAEFGVLCRFFTLYSIFSLDIVIDALCK